MPLEHFVKEDTSCGNVGQGIPSSSATTCSDTCVNLDPALPYEHFVKKDICRLYGNAGHATKNECSSKAVVQ